MLHFVFSEAFVLLIAFAWGQSRWANLFYNPRCIYDRGEKMLDISIVRNLMCQDLDSIWLTILYISGVNKNGEIIAQGKTIYGEQQAVLISPIK